MEIKEEWKDIKQFAGLYQVSNFGRVRSLDHFGINHEKQPNRIQRLYHTHTKIYHYILDKLSFREVMDYMGVPYEPVIDRQLKLDLKEER